MVNSSFCTPKYFPEEIQMQESRVIPPNVGADVTEGSEIQRPYNLVRLSMFSLRLAHVQPALRETHTKNSQTLSQRVILLFCPLLCHKTSVRGKCPALVIHGQ